MEYIQKLGREQLYKKIQLLWPRKSVERYNPDKEDIKNWEYKDLLRSVEQDHEKLERAVDNARTVYKIQFTQKTEFGTMMRLIKNYTVIKHTLSAESGAWKKIELMRSTIPLAYVDITYDFFINIIPYGVLTNQNLDGEILGSSYSRCTKVRSKMVTVVSFKIN